jgi:hypothetical protein
MLYCVARSTWFKLPLHCIAVIPSRSTECSSEPSTGIKPPSPREIDSATSPFQTSTQHTSTIYTQVPRARRVYFDYEVSNAWIS